jgi:hypothetical protein
MTGFWIVIASYFVGFNHSLLAGPRAHWAVQCGGVVIAAAILFLLVGEHT